VFTLEAGTTDLWKRFTLLGGEAIGIDRFGASARANALADGFGFDASTVAQRIAAALP
jgi:transketolase